MHRALFLVTKMKTLPKLCKLLSIAMLLTVINGNACFAQFPGQDGHLVIAPHRYECMDLLELEKIKVDPQTQTITYPDIRLATDYVEVAGWLSGWFSAWNTNKNTGGNFTKGANMYPIMPWIFSYCRAHPSKNLEDAAFELLNAFRRDTRK